MGDFDRPFRGSTAIRAGTMTRHGLTRFRRLHRDVYVAHSAERSPVNRAHAAVLWAQGNGVLAGYSASAMHGSRWIDDHQAAELIRTGTARSPRGIVVRTESLRPDEVTIRAGLPVTTAARTAFDLGRWLEFDAAIVAIDALCNATKLEPAEVLRLADRHPRARGICQLREVIDLVDGGAASPQETTTRLLIVRAGLPRPETQVPIVNQQGRTVAESDMGWERWRLVVEYDGEHHWLDPVQRSRDIDRYQMLEELGWAVVRVDAKLLHQRPAVVLRRVRTKLAAAGAPIAAR